MTTHERATIIALGGLAPRIPASALVMPHAFISGDVVLGEHVSVWPNASLRAEQATIVIGDDSNVQDASSLHVDAGSALTIGARVSIGHNAVVHGCTIEDDVLVGMHATVMNGAVVGRGSIIAAGALVSQGVVIPPNSLVAGVPGKVRRETTAEERAGIAKNAASYTTLRELYQAAIA